MKNKALTPCIKYSVVIPTFNREKTIGKALQYFGDDFYLKGGEVLVVDDASKDQTCALIEKEFPKAKILRHPFNQGAAAARNTGIRASQGEYVAFLDSDDIWYPEKLSKQLAYFETLDSSVGGVFSAYHYHKNNRLKTISFEENRDWFQYFLKGCFISPGSGLVVRRSTFEKIGFFDERMKRLEDWDWLLRLSQQYSLKVINEPLFCVNYSGMPDPKVVLNALKILENKWAEGISKADLTSFKTSITFEKLAATRKSYGVFLSLLFRDLLLNPKIFLSLILRTRLHS